MEDRLLAPDAEPPSARPVGGEYGSYNHFLMAIRIPKVIPELSSAKEALRFSRSHSPEDQIRVALSDLAMLHEIRHFHDCFGTRAGISLFRCHISRITAFLDVCKKLYEEGRYLKLPIVDWASTSDCPDYVKVFLRRLAKNVIFESIFSGRVEFSVTQGPTSTIYRNFEAAPGGYIPAFPLQVGTVIVYEGDHPPSDHGTNTHWQAIGFEQLIEGNAQALQRTYLEAIWPSISESVWKMTTSHAVLPDTEFAEYRDFIRLPYNVTDFLLTKYLSKTHNITAFHRDRLLEITDRALMFGTCAQLEKDQMMAQPGGGFVLTMEGADWSRGTKKPVSERKVGVASLQRILAAYSKTPKPVPYSGRNMQSSVDYIWSYAIHEIVVPLIKMRIKRGDEIFFDAGEYMKHYRELPFPPIIFSDSGVKSLHGVETKELLHHWSKYAILSDVCRQIWSGASFISCARAYNALLGIGRFDLAYAPYECETAIKNRDCLTWDPKFNDPLPQCVFRDALMTLRLMPFS
ncbi:hypothetical protein AWB71_06005 [Caballeronia peredens]|nr:hypothetical protein AWB71_06005 [Caballeronia peredens]